jgi:HK97 family phage major capsid protein
MLQASTLGIDVGPGGPTRYSLLGYPVIIDQAMPTWAADDVIGAGFGDWREAYIVRHVKAVQVLVNPFIATGYVGYDAWARMDGKVQNASAYVTGEGT